MKTEEGACLVCGKPLQYFETEREMRCSACGKLFWGNACCTDGHYICDACHASGGLASIMAYCRQSSSTDPLAMAQEMMDNPYIHMHGNEHHVLVGAALLTAYHNAGGALDLDVALQEMQKRGSKYPGGACGYWGCCGAAVSAGMFLSIALQTTPLSGKAWGDGNRLTASALEEIGKLGGPRCCKRNSYTAIRAAVSFVAAQYGVHMTLSTPIVCRHSHRNEQCKHEACPYFPNAQTPTQTDDFQIKNHVE